MSEEVKDVKAILERKFPDKCIQQREVQGKKLDYVPHDLVNRRLNEAYGDGGWQWEELEMTYMIEAEQVIVKFRLGVPDGNGGWAWKTQYGGSQVFYYKGKDHLPENIISLADNIKSAASDALKKCSSLLGIGLHLYGQDEQAALAAQDAPRTPSGKSGGDKGGSSAEGGMGKPKGSPELRAAGKAMLDRESVVMIETALTQDALRTKLMGDGKTELYGIDNVKLYHALLDDESNWKVDDNPNSPANLEEDDRAHSNEGE